MTEGQIRSAGEVAQWPAGASRKVRWSTVAAAGPTPAAGSPAQSLARLIRCTISIRVVIPVGEPKALHPR